MNVELLLQVKRHILEEPNRLRMSNWVISKRDTPRFGQIINGKFHPRSDNSWGESAPQEFPACGTIACIAGWTVLLSKSTAGMAFMDTDRRASELLGIDFMVSDKLFSVEGWPEPYRIRYVSARKQEERAQIVAEVIDNYIATH
jgi:hypothetical protein